MVRDERLLRPFDVKTANVEAILWLGDLDTPVVFIGRGRNNTTNVVEHPSHSLMYVEDDRLKMAPLCWVEGRPVYKGDVLYRPGIDDGPVVASNIENVDGDDYLVFEGSDRDEFADNRRGYMTWTEPNPILCEVEGKPVRKGDRLWSNYFKEWFTVNGTRVAIKEVSLINERGGDTLATSCRWKRKVKKQGFINIYPPVPGEGKSAIASTATAIYPNKGMADALSGYSRTACLQVEWEEEVLE